jgi:hypothetical protein
MAMEETLTERRRRMRAEAALAAETTHKLEEAEKKALTPEPVAVNLSEVRSRLHLLIDEDKDMPAEMKAHAKVLLTPIPAPLPPTPPPAPKIDCGATIHPNLSFERGGQLVTDKWQVVMVGAGGVGARLAPMIVKHLTNGDILHIVDGDLVEAKNIMRQHFTPNDIGQPKAQIVAQRARATAPRDGIDITFSPMMLDDITLPNFSKALCYPLSSAGAELFGEAAAAETRSTILITAVDTLKARKDIAAALHRALGGGSTGRVKQLIWIDCGNATSSGQAFIAGFMPGADVNVQLTGGKSAKMALFDRSFRETWREILPGFLDRDDAPAAAGGPDNCAIRIDPQTVLANSWAALAAASIAIPIISLSGIRTAGINFSVTGSATVAPISENIVYGHQHPKYKLVSRKLA